MLIHLLDIHLVLVFGLYFFGTLLFDDILQLGCVAILLKLVWELCQDNLNYTKVILLDKVQQILDLLDLTVRWLKNFRRASVIIHNGY